MHELHAVVEVVRPALDQRQQHGDRLAVAILAVQEVDELAPVRSRRGASALWATNRISMARLRPVEAAVEVVGDVLDRRPRTGCARRAPPRRSWRSRRPFPSRSGAVGALMIDDTIALLARLEVAAQLRQHELEQPGFDVAEVLRLRAPVGERECVPAPAVLVVVAQPARLAARSRFRRKAMPSRGPARSCSVWAIVLTTDS